MKPDFEELDYCNTPMGEITLRRRIEPRLRIEVYEVKLGDEFLMSSLFPDGEVALARLPDKRFHAILLDIDHSPRHVLHPDHAAFYSPDGLRRLAAHLQPQGVFGLWSNDPPDEAFSETLAGVFSSAQAHVVEFHNPLQDREARNTVYLAWGVKE